jgi:hypothetical protein
MILKTLSSVFALILRVRSIKRAAVLSPLVGRVRVGVGKSEGFG